MANNFKPNRNGYIALMKSAGMQSVMGDKAKQVANIAESFGSASYASKTAVGKVRAYGFAYTPSYHAMYSNAKHNSLYKALSGL